MMRWSVMALVLGLCVACNVPYEPPEWIQGTWSTDRDGASGNRTDWEFTSDNIIRTMWRGGTIYDVTDFMELSGKYREEHDETHYHLINPLSPEDDEWGHLFTRRTSPDELDWQESSISGTSNPGPLYRIE